MRGDYGGEGVEPAGGGSDGRGAESCSEREVKVMQSSGSTERKQRVCMTAEVWKF